MRELKGVTKAGGSRWGREGAVGLQRRGGVYSKTMQLLLVFCYEQRSPDHTGRFHNCFFCSHCVVWRKEEEKKKLNVTRIRWRTYWFPM